MSRIGPWMAETLRRVVAALALGHNLCGALQPILINRAVSAGSAACLVPRRGSVSSSNRISAQSGIGKSRSWRRSALTMARAARSRVCERRVRWVIARRPHRRPGTRQGLSQLIGTCEMSAAVGGYIRAVPLPIVGGVRRVSPIPPAVQQTSPHAVGRDASCATSYEASRLSDLRNPAESALGRFHVQRSAGA